MFNGVIYVRSVSGYDRIARFLNTNQSNLAAEKDKWLHTFVMEQRGNDEPSDDELTNVVFLSEIGEHRLLNTTQIDGVDRTETMKKGEIPHASECVIIGAMKPEEYVNNERDTLLRLWTRDVVSGVGNFTLCYVESDRHVRRFETVTPQQLVQKGRGWSATVCKTSLETTLTLINFNFSIPSPCPDWGGNFNRRLSQHHRRCCCSKITI